MPVTNTDAILHYSVGVFGDAGYGVPNWSNDVGSINPGIIDVCNLIGQSLFAVMHHEDVDLRIPPSINTLRRVHKLYLRSKQLLAGRAVPPNEANMETVHSRPAGEVFRVYPVPFFKVRNPFMRRWAEWILIALAEAMQHTENRKELEFSTAFAGQIGQYMTRVYQNMAIELFGKTRDVAMAAGFELAEEDFTSFDPTKFFTATELVDTVPRLDRVFTEDGLELLREGIPVTYLPELKPWPNNLTDYYAATRTDATVGVSAAGSAAAAASGFVMPPAPQP
ncbi:hypothetical protein [Lacipirellula sp.]|uniref:hypothetical protein n=1 Tax=Lacipirellula sp. TaxID=2691419 RepID=UPI003D0F0B26